MVHPLNIYLFKVNNRNAKKRFEICSKLTKKASERHQWQRQRQSGPEVTPKEILQFLNETTIQLK